MKATILVGDAETRLLELEDQTVQTCVTSPPYWGLRDYGADGQLGLESTPDEYVSNMVQLFRQVHRVLRDDGTLWLNLGDSYAADRGGTHQPAETLAGGQGGRMADGSIVNRGRSNGYTPSRNAPAIGLKHKDLIGIPWRVAFALQADGWYLRQDIIWHKPNVMPESVRDRCTKAHEYLFLLTKSPRYYYDHDSIREPNAESSIVRAAYSLKTNRPSAKTGAGGIDTDEMGTRLVNPRGRNKRSVWTIAPARFRGAHFAVMPEALVEPCILAGSRPDDTVLDPFAGSGTVGVVALRHGRNFVGTELNPEYAALANERLLEAATMFDDVEVRP